MKINNVLRNGRGMQSSFRFTATMRGRFRVSLYALSPTNTLSPHYQYPYRVVHLLQYEPTLTHHYYPKSITATELSLGVAHYMGFNECIMTCAYHYNVTLLTAKMSLSRRSWS
jgi:hypothetical protein